LPALAFLFSAGLLGVIIPNLSKQQGAAGGFVADTIGTLVACSLYKAPYTDALGPLISSMLVLAIILLVLAGALTLVTKRFESLFGLVALVLGLAFAAPTALQALLHTPFPVEQKALYYVPLFGFALVFGLDWLATTPGPRHSAVASTVLSACIAVACTGHFAGSYSVETCYNWWFDRHNGKVLRAINRDRRAHCRDCTIHIGNGWIQEPSLNFYRIARNYTWLAPIKRQSLRGPENQYLYGFAHDMPEPIDPRAKILSFSDTNTVLVRVGSASVTSTP
jgi:hypothetical protein